MPNYLVILRRDGPRWDPQRPMEEQEEWPAHARFMDDLVASGIVVLGGPLADEQRVALACVAPSAPELRAVLDGDPWAGSHLVVSSIEPWTIRLRTANG